MGADSPPLQAFTEEPKEGIKEEVDWGVMKFI